MRYHTKELNEKMGKCLCYGLIKINKKAETFDEKFFRELYAKKLNERLASDKSISEMKFDDVFSESDFEDKAAFEQARQDYKPYVITEKDTRRNFAAQYRRAVRKLRKVLPDDILSKVADIRVLALDVTSADVKRLITAFSKKHRREVNRVFKELEKAEKREFGDNLPDFDQENLHDCKVLSCRMKGKNLVLELDNSGGFTAATEVIFKNAEIIEREGRLTGAVWIYDEIYKCERGLEIHALLWYSNGLRYLTVQCENTEFVFDKSEK